MRPVTRDELDHVPTVTHGSSSGYGLYGWMDNDKRQNVVLSIFAPLTDFDAFPGGIFGLNKREIWRVFIASKQEAHRASGFRSLICQEFAPRLFEQQVAQMDIFQIRDKVVARALMKFAARQEEHFANVLARTAAHPEQALAFARVVLESDKSPPG
jgi:hypothetical protein